MENVGTGRGMGRTLARTPTDSAPFHFFRDQSSLNVVVTTLAKEETEANLGKMVEAEQLEDFSAGKVDKLMGVR